MSGSLEPTRESLRAHALPEWYQDAKLGIFIHWTPASVPGFAPREQTIGELLRERYDDLMPLSPYTEWYENAIRFPWSPSARFHRERYGERPYAAFAGDFVAGLAHWRPEAWAERFAAAGARYVVMVTKHHDGFCLWPSRVPHPKRSGWRTERDCVGELAAAVRARGMRFGVYYSGGVDWSFDARPVRDFGDFIASIPRGAYPAYAEAQVRELVERVAPSVLWNDIAWPGDERSLLRLFADYYEAVPEGIVNDRWITPSLPIRALRIRPFRALVNARLKRSSRRPGAGVLPPPSVHFDVRTPEYAVFPDIRAEKWECVRGMDKSFGFNRNSRPEDFLSREELIHSLVDIASKNGNLLLNVGPRGEDAAIPEPQLERLAWLGAWLGRNGEALYGARPWQRAEGRTRCGVALRFTCRGERLYAILLGTPREREVVLEDVPLPAGAEVALLGAGPVAAAADGGDLRLRLPGPLPAEPAHVLAIAPPAAARPAPAQPGSRPRS
jgi:alpha-L-fucosidase